MDTLGGKGLNFLLQTEECWRLLSIFVWPQIFWLVSCTVIFSELFLCVPQVFSGHEVVDGSVTVLKNAMSGAIIDQDRILLGAEEGLFSVDLHSAGTFCSDPDDVLKTKMFGHSSFYYPPIYLCFISGKKFFITSLIFTERWIFSYMVRCMSPVFHILNYRNNSCPQMDFLTLFSSFFGT